MKYKIEERDLITAYLIGMKQQKPLIFEEWKRDLLKQ
jgi:hypothetical protein